MVVRLMDPNQKRKVNMNKFNNAKRRRSFSPSPPASSPSTANIKETSSSKQYDVVEKIWNESNPDKVISTINNVRLTAKDLQTLKQDIWLNDEIINSYMDLIRTRSQKNLKLPKIYAFSTFFYTTLKQRGYAGVSRWTSKLNIFSFDLLLFPIHSTDHWALVAIDLKNDLYGYFDSIEFPTNEEAIFTGRDHIKKIFNYLKQESLERRKMKYERKSKKASTYNSPIQNNENDCGVFICCYAEGLARGCAFGKFDFDQNDIPSKRRQITYELFLGNLLK